MVKSTLFPFIFRPVLIMLLRVNNNHIPPCISLAPRKEIFIIGFIVRRSFSFMLFHSIPIPLRAWKIVEICAEGEIGFLISIWYFIPIKQLRNLSLFLEGGTVRGVCLNSWNIILIFRVSELETNPNREKYMLKYNSQRLVSFLSCRIL